MKKSSEPCQVENLPATHKRRWNRRRWRIRLAFPFGKAIIECRSLNMICNSPDMRQRNFSTSSTLMDHEKKACRATKLRKTWWWLQCQILQTADGICVCSAPNSANSVLLPVSCSPSVIYGLSVRVSRLVARRFGELHNRWTGRMDSCTKHSTSESDGRDAGRKYI